MGGAFPGGEFVGVAGVEVAHGGVESIDEGLGLGEEGFDGGGVFDAFQLVGGLDGVAGGQGVAVGTEVGDEVGGDEVGEEFGGPGTGGEVGDVLGAEGLDVDDAVGAAAGVVVHDGGGGWDWGLGAGFPPNGWRLAKSEDSTSQYLSSQNLRWARLYRKTLVFNGM